MEALRLRPLREIALIVAVFFGYRQIRYLTRNDTEQAVENARRVVDLERHGHFFSERGLQNLVLHSDAVVGFLNRYYVFVHFPLTALFVAWVLTRHQSRYRMLRTWMISVTVIALAIHVLYPLAPPRMLVQHGFVDTLREYGPNIYSTDTSDSVANQYAAMPSLHFGWAVIVAAGFIGIRWTRRSLLAIAHPALTLLAIVATANHFWIDAAVAFVLVAGTAAVLQRWCARGDQREIRFGLFPYPRITGRRRNLDGLLGRPASGVGFPGLVARFAEVDPTQGRLANPDIARTLFERLDRGAQMAPTLRKVSQSEVHESGGSECIAIDDWHEALTARRECRAS
ncbi:MAG: phosphatase PAP2 family protein [Acidimicrobiales bacterium]